MYLYFTTSSHFLQKKREWDSNQQSAVSSQWINYQWSVIIDQPRRGDICVEIRSGDYFEPRRGDISVNVSIA